MRQRYLLSPLFGVGPDAPLEPELGRTEPAEQFTGTGQHHTEVDLHHHGDSEITSGLLDFAVNVSCGPRPEWLDAALHAALAEASRYPDATAARDALARRNGEHCHRPGCRGVRHRRRSITALHSTAGATWATGAAELNARGQELEVPP